MRYKQPLFLDPKASKPEGIIQEKSRGDRQGPAAEKVSRTGSDETGRRQAGWIQEGRSGDWDRAGGQDEGNRAGKAGKTSRTGNTSGEDTRRSTARQGSNTWQRYFTTLLCFAHFKKWSDRQLRGNVYWVTDVVQIVNKNRM